MRLVSVVFIIIFIGINLKQSYGQSIPDLLLEESIIDTIWSLKEVQVQNKYVIKESKNKRQLSILVYKKPNETEKGYYWIKVVEDNGINLVSHFNFYVYPITNKIMYLDTLNEIEIDLSKWRKQRLKTELN